VSCWASWPSLSLPQGEGERPQHVPRPHHGARRAHSPQEPRQDTTAPLGRPPPSSATTTRVRTTRQHRATRTPLEARGGCTTRRRMRRRAHAGRAQGASAGVCHRRDPGISYAEGTDCTLSRRLRFLPHRVRLRAIKSEAMSSARAFLPGIEGHGRWPRCDRSPHPLWHNAPLASPCVARSLTLCGTQPHPVWHAAASAVTTRGAATLRQPHPL